MASGTGSLSSDKGEAAIEAIEMHEDSSATFSITKESLKEEHSLTPTLIGYIKNKTAEEYFSTGESKTNTPDATITPRQMTSGPGTDGASGSHMKTPKMSNMRHLLGNLTDDLASPEHTAKQRRPGQTAEENKVQQRTPGHTETPAPHPPARVQVNDSSSSSSGKADSNSTSSDSGGKFVMVKAAYRTTATSRNTSPPKKNFRRTPGSQQAAVANRLLGRPEHSKPQAPHAIHQLREPERQDSFEFPPLSAQPAPASGGVIWRLVDTPADHEGKQQQTSTMPDFQPPAEDWTPSKHPAYSSGRAGPWDMAAMSESLPAAIQQVPAISSGHGAPPHLREEFLQPQTAPHYQPPPLGCPMGAVMTGAHGPRHVYSQLPSASSMLAHRSFYGSQENHMPAMQDESVDYTSSQGMQSVQPAYMSAGMVASQPTFTPPPLYTIPEADVPRPAMQTSGPSFENSPFAGDFIVPVMRNGRPYLHNGVPLRIPLRETTNNPDGQDMRKLTTMCYIQASKGQVPANVDKQTVKKLVQQQIEASKPIRAPWYREGPRNARGYITRDKKASASVQHTGHSDNIKSKKEESGKPTSSSSNQMASHGHSMTQGTGCFIPTTGRACRLPREAHRLSAKAFEGISAGPSSLNPAATSWQAPAAAKVAGGRYMAVGTGCFIPSG